jgi:hypothetical protein
MIEREIHRFYYPGIVAIFLFGTLLRFYACLRTYIINPDGTLYIHQARALFYGQWDQLTSCGLGYLSPFPILVTLSYFIFNDWVSAARFVSLAFGSLCLLPLYFLLAQFLQKDIRLLALLVFAVVPDLVGRSADVIRDPMSWFFNLLALACFTRQMGANNYRLPLIFSSLAFLLAAWARAEALTYLLGSACYLLLAGGEKKYSRLLFFILPVLVLLLAAILEIAFDHSFLTSSFRVSEVQSRLLGLFDQYGALRSQLKSLSHSSLNNVLLLYLEQSRSLIWFTAFGVLLAYTIKLLFYPYFLVFLIGVMGIRKRAKKEPRLAYLIVLSLSALMLIYGNVLQSWYVDSRFLVLFVLPSFVFIGFGLERVVQYLTGRFNFSRSLALAMLCLMIIGLALPKNLSPREADKTVFKSIGELIAKREGKKHLVRVMASPHSIRWISFYANLEYPGAPCPQALTAIYSTDSASYEDFIQNLKKRGVKYFLWEETHWPKNASFMPGEAKAQDLMEIQRFHHHDTGALILFKVL